MYIVSEQGGSQGRVTGRDVVWVVRVERGKIIIL